MRRTLKAALVPVAAVVALALSAPGCGPAPAAPAAHRGKGPALGPQPPRPTTSTTNAVEALGSDPSVLGLVLSGRGASLSRPLSPTNKAYGPDCHLLIDPGFSGKCAVATGPKGTVAGVVEEETAALEGPAKARPATTRAPGAQERDLVWRRHGRSWTLALRRVFTDTLAPTRLWAGDVPGAGSPGLVFVTPSNATGFGNELDIVGGAGTVNLYRFLGEGFVVVPRPGELVTYVPGWTEQRPVEWAYDQTLIAYTSGSWRVVSQQYVPDPAALAQHHGVFRDATAVPAS
jgi:hypothetical protein